MKWIGSKIEQFTTTFYGDLHGSVIEASMLSVGENAFAFDGYSLLIYKTGSGSNVINFYNQGVSSADNSFNFQLLSPTSTGGEFLGNMLNIHKYGITASNGLSHGATPTALIDNNQASNLAGNSVGLHVDFDRTVPTGGTAVHNDTGINLDVTSDSLGSGSTTVGMDIDVVSGTSSTSDNQVATGIHLDVDGADTNIGMVINTAGTHLKLEANADVNDYATFTLADTGDLTIATVGSASIDSDLTLDADGQIKLEPAAGKNILLDGTIAIDEGVVTGATSITSTAFVGDLTGKATVNKGTKHFGDYIKLLPSDFVANIDGGNTKFGVGYVNTAGDDYGINVANAATELFAFVSIPDRMKATHVEVFGRRPKAVEVFEVQINATTMTSLGTGTCGTGSDDIGDEEFALSSEVTSTATNLLVIEVTVTSNSADKVYGARVKIAAI